MDALVSEGSSRVAMAVLSDGEVVYVDERRGPEFVPLTGTEIGQRRPPHHGAHGMALMAYLRDGDVDELLRKYPLVKRASGSLLDPEEFKRRLKEVREKGYAYGESARRKRGASQSPHLSVIMSGRWWLRWGSPHRRAAAGRPSKRQS